MPKINEDTQSIIDTINPRMYKVIMHNDDYTPMDFVVEVLQKIFHKNAQEAEDIMWRVHQKGKAVCGVYVKDIAQTKVFQTKQMAKANGHPLLVTIEEEG